jgi:uncharacterized protein (TIGR02118 family)
MHKIVILIETPEDESAFMDEWPLFLFLAERMPGLRKETSSHIGKTLFGSASYSMIHELYFDSLEALKEAMASDEGRLAGTQLQKMTHGRVGLLIADHNEDDLERFRPAQPASAPAVKQQDEPAAQNVPEPEEEQDHEAAQSG